MKFRGSRENVEVNMSRVAGNKLRSGLFSNILIWSNIIIHFLYLLLFIF